MQVRIVEEKGGGEGERESEEEETGDGNAGKHVIKEGRGVAADLPTWTEDSIQEARRVKEEEIVSSFPTVTLILPPSLVWKILAVTPALAHIFSAGVQLEQETPSHVSTSRKSPQPDEFAPWSSWTTNETTLPLLASRIQLQGPAMLLPFSWRLL